jgi:ABC-2 type transport system permease protein/lipopolysaccharide transport system permease protein
MTTGTTGSHRAASASSWRTWHGYAPLDAGIGPRFSAASGDLVEGARRWRLWSYLAIDGIKNQYNRTVIGPWWITLQNAIYIAALGYLFGTVFDRPIDEFMPYVGCGYIAFGLIAGTTRVGANVFTAAGTGIVSNRQPLSALVFTGVASEFLQFAHHLLIIVAFGVLGWLTLGPATLLVIPSIVLMLVNGVAVGLWLGPMVARYRDVGPLVASLIQMLAFFTPIFWAVDSLRGQSQHPILVWNPFYYLLETFRGPLLGTTEARLFVGAALVTVVNVFLAVVVFARVRSRIPYWVS